MLQLGDISTPKKLRQTIRKEKNFQYCHLRNKKI